jgi:hypothetical protein
MLEERSERKAPEAQSADAARAYSERQAGHQIRYKARWRRYVAAAGFARAMSARNRSPLIECDRILGKIPLLEQQENMTAKIFSGILSIPALWRRARAVERCCFPVRGQGASAIRCCQLTEGTLPFCTDHADDAFARVHVNRTGGDGAAGMGAR